MLARLIQLECKMWLKSIIFYAYIILLFLFYVTQMGEDTSFKKPQPGQMDYGTTYSKDQNIIMKGTVRDLLFEHSQGHYVSYPYGFYKEVILSKKDESKMEEYLTSLTGKSKEERINPEDFNIRPGLSFEEFKSIMNKVAHIIGPGSEYSENALQRHGRQPRTFEQALSDYNNVISKDHITGAFGRLFCDYMGIILGILPAFFSIARVLRDKRSKCSDVVFSKKGASMDIVLSRYVGMIIVMFLPLILVSCLSLSQAVYIAQASQVSPDYFAFIKYSLGWLLPTMMFVTAISYWISELTGSVLTIFAGVAIWFLSIFTGMGANLINVGWNLIPRFNALGEHERYKALLPELIKNRVFYTVISSIVVLMVIVVVEWKRNGGGYTHGKVSQNFIREHKI